MCCSFHRAKFVQKFFLSSESIAFYSLLLEGAALKCPFFTLSFFSFLLFPYNVFYYKNKGWNIVRFPDIFGSVLLTHEIQSLGTINWEKLTHMKEHHSCQVFFVGCLKFWEWGKESSKNRWLSPVLWPSRQWILAHKHYLLEWDSGICLVLCEKQIQEQICKKSGIRVLQHLLTIFLKYTLTYNKCTNTLFVFL